jgi:DNA-binding FadR family transcriptional regulator
VAAAMIAEQQAPEHIEALKDYVALSKATIQGPPPSMPDHATSEDEKALEFHAMLMSMSGNPVLALIARSLQDLHVDSRRSVRPEDPKHFDEIHETIALAIIENRPELAEQLMREHMRDFAEYTDTQDPTFLDLTVSWQ